MLKNISNNSYRFWIRYTVIPKNKYQWIQKNLTVICFHQKRSLPVDDASERPSTKRTVKCGVCNKLLVEAEWKKHVAKKHNYIAWRAGETFVSSNLT